MIVFPNCKINLGLHIISRRDDGFHNLKTLFYPISLRDSLEIVPVLGRNDIFSSSGMEIPRSNHKNLCEQALDLVREAFRFPRVHIHLHKNIPIGAGLGGGSSDAVFTLLLLNQLFNLGIPAETMHMMAEKLGSDCPFFLENKPCLARGRGEILESFTIQLKGYYLVLAMPDIHVSTREAFSGIIPKEPSIDLAKWLKTPPSNWKKKILNDFEQSVFNKHPRIGEIKNIFYDYDAVYASMSGSGASVYGIFSHKPDDTLHLLLKDCFIWEEQL